MGVLRDQEFLIDSYDVIFKMVDPFYFSHRGVKVMGDNTEAFVGGYNMIVPVGFGDLAQFGCIMSDGFQSFVISALHKDLVGAIRV